MFINSSSFADGKIAVTCNKMGGRTVSTGVHKKATSGTTHVAIIMDDTDAKSVAGKTWVRGMFLISRRR